VMIDTRESMHCMDKSDGLPKDVEWTEYVNSWHATKKDSEE